MKDEYKWLLAYFSIAAALLGAFLVCLWVRAGIQAEVYHRQGIKITRWEILWGARPAWVVTEGETKP